MRFGADARARLAVLPVFALVLPWPAGPALAQGRGEGPDVPVVPATLAGASERPAVPMLPAMIPATVATSRAPGANPVPRPARSAAEPRRTPFNPLAPLAPFGPFVPVAHPLPAHDLPQPVARGPVIPRGPGPSGPSGAGGSSGPPHGSADAETAAAKHEGPVGRVAPPPRPPPVRMITLPEEVVLKAINVGQQAFLRCWVRAQRVDPAPSAGKVALHLELDAAGKVIASTSDTDSPLLSRCLAIVAQALPFPAPGRPAVVDLPLMFH